MHLDMTLPIVDVGCGNGRFTRRLSTSFPRAVGVDLSENAVALAAREASGIPGLTFRAVDGTAPAAADTLRAELGADANVFVRGVFHVLDQPGQGGAGPDPAARRRVDDELLAHISPAQSENIGLFGTITVDIDHELAQLDPTVHRPLRQPTVGLKP